MRRGLLGFASFCLTACFGEAPVGSSGDASSSSSSSTSSSSDESESSTSADTSSSSASSTLDPDTSSSSESSDGSSSESTGDPPDECLCPEGSIECESFEDGFAPDNMVWNVPLGGVDPEVIADPVHCGVAAVRTAVQPGDSYSAVSHALPPELLAPGVHRLEAWVQLQDFCLAAPTRILQVQRGGPPPQFQFSYGIELFVDDVGFELRLQDAMGVYDPTAARFDLAKNAWYDIAIEFDLSVQPPVVSVIVDGEVVIAAEGPASTIMPADPRLGATLGVFQPAPFEVACTAIYDDFSAG